MRGFDRGSVSASTERYNSDVGTLQSVSFNRFFLVRSWLKYIFPVTVDSIFTMKTTSMY